MFAIGNDELERNGPLGNSVQCAKCGAEHQVQFGEPDQLHEKLLCLHKTGEAL